LLKYQVVIRIVCQVFRPSPTAPSQAAPNPIPDKPNHTNPNPIPRTKVQQGNKQGNKQGFYLILPDLLLIWFH